MRKSATPWSDPKEIEGPASRSGRMGHSQVREFDGELLIRANQGHTMKASKHAVGHKLLSVTPDPFLAASLSYS